MEPEPPRINSESETIFFWRTPGTDMPFFSDGTDIPGLNLSISHAEAGARTFSMPQHAASPFWGA
jgi:hypothetical protein